MAKTKFSVKRHEFDGLKRAFNMPKIVSLLGVRLRGQYFR